MANANYMGRLGQNLIGVGPDGRLYQDPVDAKDLERYEQDLRLGVIEGVPVKKAGKASYSPHSTSDITELIERARGFGMGDGGVAAPPGMAALPGMVQQSAMGAAPAPRSALGAPEQGLDVAGEELANNRILTARLGEAGAGLVHAISGAKDKPDVSFFRGIAASAEKDSEDRLTRYREILKRKADLEAKKAATADEHAWETQKMETQHQNRMKEQAAKPRGSGSGGTGGTGGADGLTPYQRIQLENARAKLAAEEAGKNIPGATRIPGSNQGPDDVKKVKASMAAAERMRRYVTRLRALHDEYGTEAFGPTSVEMDQLMTQIRLEAKTIADLGALSGPDAELMEALSGASPSSAGANVKALFGVDNTGAALDGLERWTGDTLGANMQVYGYKPNAPAIPQSAPAQKATRRTDPNTGETRVWNGSAWVKE